MQNNLEQAEFFENRHKAKLFGILHRPQQPANSNLGVVFCHPIAWEKQFSYRSFAEFSRYLAKQGHSSLRFDAYGFGDSDGDFVEATIESQIEDVLDAIERLRQSEGCTRFVLVGVRLGASIAALAAARSSDVEGLVLVSPVVNGANYWKEMVRFSRFGRMSNGQQLISSKELNAQLENNGAAEIDGDCFSRNFVEELKAINLSSQSEGFAGRCLLRELTSGGTAREDLEVLVERMRQHGTVVDLSYDEPKEFWVIANRYKGYLPRDLYKRTATWLNEAPKQ